MNQPIFFDTEAKHAMLRFVEAADKSSNTLIKLTWVLVGLTVGIFFLTLVIIFIE